MGPLRPSYCAIGQLLEQRTLCDQLAICELQSQRDLRLHWPATFARDLKALIRFPQRAIE